MAVNNVPLSNVEIDEYYRDDNRYRGVHYNTQLKDLPPLKAGEFMIVAIDPAEGARGLSHFVAIKLLNDGKTAIYFNSSGREICRYIAKYLTRSRIDTLLQSDSMYQSMGSMHCGYYCIYVLDQLNAGVSYAEIVKVFKEHHTADNEKLIVNYFIKQG